MTRSFEGLMPQRFHALRTVFIFIRGHHLLERYFDMADAREAAND